MTNDIDLRARSGSAARVPVAIGDQNAQRGAGQIYTVQWLRAVAAVLVVVFHTSQGVEFRTGIMTSDWTGAGATGVDIFFVVSGFIMTTTTMGKPFHARDFLIRRLIRVIPVYWALTLLKAAALVIMPSMVLFSVLSLPNIVTSLLLVPYDTPGRGAVPLIIVAWSLEFELFFYFLFAACRQISDRHWVALIAATLVALSAVHFIAIGSPVIDFYARPILLEFLFGILIAIAFRNDRLPKRGVGMHFLVLAAASVLLLSPGGSETTRVLVWGLPAAALVLGMVALERRHRFWRWRPMVFVGDSSYSLYLTHTLAVPFIMLPLKYIHVGSGGSIVYLVAATGVQLVIGGVVYQYFERPVTAFFQSHYRNFKSRVPGK